MSGFPQYYGEGGYGVGGTIPQPSNSTTSFVPSITYYLSLITSEYQGCPKFMAWMAALLQPISDFCTLLSNFAFPAFDLDWAVGPQLDILGQWIGAERTVAFQPSNGFSPVLTDAVYRILLQAKIAQNQWDGHIASLYPIWAALFPGGIIYIQDNQNMTVTITLSGGFSSIVQDLISNGYIIPRPEGVQYTFEFATLPIFGFDGTNPSFIAGFDVGHWG